MSFPSPGLGRRLGLYALADGSRLLFVFLLSLGLRLAYLGRLVQSPLFDSPAMDAAIHDDWAYSLAGRGGWVSDGAYFRAPLYPYFLSLFYRFSDRSFGLYVAMRVVQFMIGALGCALITVLGERLFGRRAGLLAGILAALYWPFIYFEGELLLDNLLWVLILSGLLTLVSSFQTKALAPRQSPSFQQSDGTPRGFEAPSFSRRRVFLGGGLFGLAAITRPNILLFFPVAIGWLYLRQRDKRAALLLALGMGLPILPVTVRNFVVGGDLVLVASQGGVNFYIGNNPKSDGKTAVVPGTRPTWWGGYEDTNRIAQEAAGRALRPSEISRYWFGQGLEFLLRQPEAAARLYLRKLRLLLNPTEISNNQNTYFFRNYTGLINRPPFLGFWIAGGLGLAGMAWLLTLRRRNWPPGTGLLILFALVYLAGVWVFFVADRFRLPVMPVLMIFGGALVSDLWQKVKGEPLKSLIAPGVLLLGVFLILGLIRIPPAYADPLQPSDGHFSLANALARRHKDGEAMGHYMMGLSLKEPYRSRSYMGLGGINLRQADDDQAKSHLGAALRCDPALEEEVLNLLLDSRREDLMDDIFFTDPKPDPAAKGRLHSEAGRRLIQAQRFDEALPLYEKAVKELPGDSSLYINLGNLYSLKPEGQARAIQTYRAGLARNPGEEALWYNLVTALLAQGKKAEAAKIIREQLLARKPGDPNYAALLGQTR